MKYYNIICHQIQIVVQFFNAADQLRCPWRSSWRCGSPWGGEDTHARASRRLDATPKVESLANLQEVTNQTPQVTSFTTCQNMSQMAFESKKKNKQVAFWTTGAVTQVKSDMLCWLSRCHTPCTLWRSCHNTSTSTRRAMQSTISRKSWWLVMVSDGFWGDFHVDVRWFQPWNTEANGWSAFGFEPLDFTEIQGVGFPTFLLFVEVLSLENFEDFIKHVEVNLQLGPTGPPRCVVVGDCVTFQNMGLREFILVSLSMTCENIMPWW